MKRFCLIIISTLIFISNSNSQALRGKLVNTEGDPVSYGTVYIHELKHGTTANIKGEYLINLKPGTYNVFFQSLGYSPSVRVITIGDSDKIVNMTLGIQYYEIPEVRVTSSGEDPAYAIMRKTIGLAPYYLNQVKHYEAEIYIKGSVVVNRIPRIMERNLRVNDIQIKEGDKYLIESINLIDFTAPDTYNQTVVSQQSTFPETDQADISPMDVVKASFYQPLLAEIAISPLAPNAMSHYKFKYQGSSPQGKYIINKISVIPKRKSQQVFSGTIYIIEDLWCLHSVDLNNENLAGSLGIHQVYTPVQDDIWMPVSHNFDVKLSIVGVRADAGYGSAVTYKNLEPNTELERPEALNLPAIYYQPDDLPDPVEISKEQNKIDEILSKKELSNRDMVKLSRLMEKEAEKTDPERNDLEIKQTGSFTIEEDAGKRDSAYWNAVRPIPLSEEEIKGVRFSDSIKYTNSLTRAERKADTILGSESAGKKFSRVLNDYAFGRSWNSKDDSFSFRFEGLINIEKLSFNTVDGLVYGTQFRIRKRWESGSTLTIRPDINWAFSRERLLWRLSGSLYYNRMKQSSIVFWVGRRSQDFNNSTGIRPSLNMFTSLLFKENYLKLYEGEYVTLGHRHELVNGLYLDLRYNFEKRYILDNTTDYTFFYKDRTYTPNHPVNFYVPGPEDPPAKYSLVDHTHNSATATLTYTPGQRYRINNGAKSPAGSDFPTFSLKYTYGMNKPDNEAAASFGLISAEALKSRSIGAFSEYNWKIRAGGFINNEGLHYQDFAHFNSQPLPVLLNNYQDVFMLPSYYSLATPEYYIEAHIRYTTPYFLIKLLPVLSRTLMRENLSLAFLYTPDTHAYYELGYALSEVLLIGKVGVYVGFEDLKYKGTGVRFTFIFN